MNTNVYRHQPATLRAPGSLPKIGGTTSVKALASNITTNPKGEGSLYIENTVNTYIHEIIDPNNKRILVFRKL